MKREAICVGVGVDGITPVVSGSRMFRLIDSIGLPLDIVIQELKDRHIAFDVLGFVRAARDSKNYTPKRLTALFTENRPIADDGFDLLIGDVIKRVYSEVL